MSTNETNQEAESGSADCSKPLSLATLRLANVLRNEEWFKDERVFIPLSFRAAELAGETGEACNEIKKLERTNIGLVGGKESLDDLADELADVMISVDLIAMDLGIDLSEVIARKFNKTSDKHGMKTKIAL